MLITLSSHLLDRIEGGGATIRARIVLFRLHVHHLGGQLLAHWHGVALVRLMELVQVILTFSAGLHAALRLLLSLVVLVVEHALLAVVLGKHAVVGLGRHRDALILQTRLHLLLRQVLVGGRERGLLRHNRVLLHREFGDGVAGGRVVASLSLIHI